MAFSLTALLEESRKRSSGSLVVPERFVDFVDWLGVEFRPGQRVIAKVCYDGVQPCELVGEERELAKKIFGDVDTIPQSARNVVVLVCGRRGGKSYTLEALKHVHAMYTLPLYMVAPGQIPIALVIAPNDELRQEVVNYAIGAIRSHPQLRETLIGTKARDSGSQVSKFDIRRPGGSIVGFRSGVATEGGYGGRGKSLVSFSLDEAAFFKDETYAVSDVELLGAAIPGLLPGAKAIVPSTPWAQVGLLWDKFAANWGHPKDAVVAHAPTQLLRPELAQFVEDERAKDPERAEREFDAVFMSTGATQFLTSALIESCLRRGLELPTYAQPGDKVAAATDLGFRSDSSAMAGSRMSWGSARDTLDNGTPEIILCRLREWRPTPDAPIQPGVVIEEIAAEAKELGASWLMADQHYKESLREHAMTVPIADAPGSPDEVFVALRTLMRDKRVVWPHPDTLPQGSEEQKVMRRLIQQAKEVKGKPMPGGKMSITLPRWRTGGHGDLLFAVALVYFQLSGEIIEKPAAPEGSAEWEEAQREQRREAVRRQMAQKGTRRLI